MYTYINICTHAHPSVIYKTDNDRSTRKKRKCFAPTPDVQFTLHPTPSSRLTQMQCDILLSFQQQKNGRRGTATLAYTPHAYAHRHKGRTAHRGETNGSGMAQAAVPLSNKTLCAICKWPKDNEVCRAPLVSWVLVSSSYCVCGTTGFLLSFCPNVEDSNEISVFRQG